MFKNKKQDTKVENRANKIGNKAVIAGAFVLGGVSAIGASAMARKMGIDIPTPGFTRLRMAHDVEYPDVTYITDAMGKKIEGFWTEGTGDHAYVRAFLTNTDGIVKH